jgi:hypothetical protein
MKTSKFIFSLLAFLFMSIAYGQCPTYTPCTGWVNADNQKLGGLIARNNTVTISGGTIALTATNMSVYDNSTDTLTVRLQAIRNSLENLIMLSDDYLSALGNGVGWWTNRAKLGIDTLNQIDRTVKRKLDTLNQNARSTNSLLTVGNSTRTIVKQKLDTVNQNLRIHTKRLDTLNYLQRTPSDDPWGFANQTTPQLLSYWFGGAYGATPVIGYFGNKTTDQLAASGLETITFTGADIPTAVAAYQTWIDANQSYTIIRTHVVGLFVIVEYYAT